VSACAFIATPLTIAVAMTIAKTCFFIQILLNKHLSVKLKLSKSYMLSQRELE